jgi:hypothetical protein
MNSLVLKIIIFVTAVAGVGFVTYGAYTYKTSLENQAKEAATQVVVEVKDTSKTNIESVVNEALKEQEIKVDYMVREIDKQSMYITDNILGYEGPNEADFKEKINFTENQEVQVIGVVEQYKNESCLWYLLEGNTFVNGGYVSDKPIVVESSGVDSKGVSIELGEDEYKGDEEIITETPDFDSTINEGISIIEDMYKNGQITEATRDMLIRDYTEAWEDGPELNIPEPSNQDTHIITDNPNIQYTDGIDTGAPDSIDWNAPSNPDLAKYRIE